jgi:hypothetical protein
MRSPDHHSSGHFRLKLLILPLLLASGKMAAHGEDLQLQATLLRGDNGDPAPANHGPPPSDLGASLRRNYPWTNYYQITNLTVAIPPGESRDVAMSEHFTLKVKNLDGSSVAIDCLNSGKQISHGTNTLPVILGGDDTNHSAWFISLQAAKPSPPSKK